MSNRILVEPGGGLFSSHNRKRLQRLQRKRRGMKLFTASVRAGGGWSGMVSPRQDMERAAAF